MRCLYCTLCLKGIFDEYITGSVLCVIVQVVSLPLITLGCLIFLIPLLCFSFLLPDHGIKLQIPKRLAFLFTKMMKNIRNNLINYIVLELMFRSIRQYLELKKC